VGASEGPKLLGPFWKIFCSVWWEKVGKFSLGGKKEVKKSKGGTPAARGLRRGEEKGRGGGTGGSNPNGGGGG